jgi:hypothetical protein
MVSVYSVKRREPRVKLNTSVVVTVPGDGAAGPSFETTTIDVSPHGASVRLPEPLALGAVVRFAAKRYAFATRATVRSVAADRATGDYCVGLEYLDDVNPIVGWPTGAGRPAASEPPA